MLPASKKVADPKVLDINLEKGTVGMSRWPQLFDEDDGVQETIDPTERRAMVEAMEKYTNGFRQSASIDDADTMHDEAEADFNRVVAQWFSNGSVLRASHGIELLGLSMEFRTEIGVKRDVDVLLFDIMSSALPTHLRTYPALGYIAASKRMKRYIKFVPEASIIIEAGHSGQIYIYRHTTATHGAQSLLRLGIDVMGVTAVRTPDQVHVWIVGLDQNNAAVAARIKL